MSVGHEETELLEKQNIKIIIKKSKFLQQSDSHLSCYKLVVVERQEHSHLFAAVGRGHIPEECIKTTWVSLDLYVVVFPVS